MAIAPEHLRIARVVVPRLPLSAILGFARFGVGGSVFLACTSFSHYETKRAAAPSTEAPVYAARAVPFDPPREDPVKRAALIARALTATQTDVRRADIAEPGTSDLKPEPTLLTESNRELRGF